MIAVTIARWCLLPVRQSMAEWAASLDGSVVVAVGMSIDNSTLASNAREEAVSYTAQFQINELEAPLG